MHKERNVNLPLYGHCDAKFENVRTAFIANFIEHGEVGARVTVIQGEETVVDLWGGYIDADKTREWREDTLVNTMSVSKGVVSIAANILVDRGLIDYDAPVSKYWPEFGQAGKDKITVRQLVSHQASLVYADNAVPGDVLDFDGFSAKLAAQAPNWEPGTNQAYHSITIGFLVGTLIARVDGRRVESFIHDEMIKPLQADYILGCSDDDIKRVATTIFNPENEMMSGGLIKEKTIKCFSPLPEDPNFFATPQHWQSVCPSSSGVSNANGIARLFAPLANNGKFNGVKLFSPETVAAMTEEQWYTQDSLFGNDFRLSMGLLLNIDFNYFGREGNVGSAGAGGFVAFADPENHVSFGYTPVRMTTGSGVGDEPRRLVDAVYASVGY